MIISGPVLVMVLEKDNAIADWRALMGPTNASKAKITHPHRSYNVTNCITLHLWTLWLVHNFCRIEPLDSVIVGGQIYFDVHDIC